MIGSTHPFSGPVSAYGAIGKAISACFDKVNDEGGNNGRRIKYIDLDDGYNPAKIFNITTPKFAAQAIKKLAEIGWKPTHYLNSVCGLIGAALMPAGLDNSKGIITTAYGPDRTGFPEGQGVGRLVGLDEEGPVQV